MLKVNKSELGCSKYTRKHESGIAYFWELAWKKQATKWGAIKQCLAILELQGLINVIKELDRNTNLTKYMQI